MSYLSSLSQCASTLSDCNNILERTTTNLDGLCKTFPRVESVIRCEKLYELTTAKDIDKAQELISTEAIPFLYRQVDQLENAISLIASKHNELEHKVKVQQQAYNEFVAREKDSIAAQSELRKIRTEIAEAQELLMELKSSNSNKAHAEKGGDLLSKLESDIQHAKDQLRRVKGQINQIPERPKDMILENQTIDPYDILEMMRDIRDQVKSGPVDKKSFEVLSDSAKYWDHIEAHNFNSLWSSLIETQTPRMHYLLKLFRYLFSEEGTIMHRIIEALLENPDKSLTISELTKAFEEDEALARRHITPAVTKLRELGAIESVAPISGQINSSSSSGGSSGGDKNDITLRLLVPN
ncbi:hypothetical protein H4219_002666 [Mycoemilia scoparia]|uniref:DASH complex subunit SPC19 n=1 Tax=Mycoemilia scoparia TaxID=417184 RepID=A0A9W8DQA2_9FUNG|nr:hypothetical protein H4219_002666 [Mycoemilia scoparia]